MRQQQETEDLIGEAIRRAYRVQNRAPERFDELLRRLAEQESTARGDR